MADHQDSLLNSTSSSRNCFHQHVHAASVSSWDINNTNPNWNPQNPNSSYSSSCEEDISMSTSASLSRLTVHPTARLDAQGCVPTPNNLMEEDSADNHLWNHVLLSAEENDGNLHNNHDVGGNLINAFSLRNLSEGRLFEPACSDYLKKLDNGWEITSFEKNLNGYSNSMFETERLTKASNSVNNWSIAPPDTEISSQFNPLSSFISLSPTADQYSIPTINQKLIGSYLPLSPKLENETFASGNSLRRSLSSNGTGYPMGMDSSSVGDNCKFYGAVPDVSGNKGINFADLPGFSSNLSKPWMHKEAKPMLKSLNLSDCKKQPLKDSRMPTASRCNTLTSNRKGHALANEGKKKRYEENSDMVLKKPKQESSTFSSAKVQVPRAEWREKITSLQQMVSPFGKTDAASVLFEAINQIKLLQDQVHLLSNPYMKTNTTKDPWGGMDRKVRGQIEVDLKSRGLCLVPVLSIPQVYRDNIGPADYLTPTYRGCLYR